MIQKENDKKASRWYDFIIKSLSERGQYVNNFSNLSIGTAQQ